MKISTKNLKEDLYYSAAHATSSDQIQSQLLNSHINFDSPQPTGACSNCFGTLGTAFTFGTIYGTAATGGTIATAFCYGGDTTQEA